MSTTFTESILQGLALAVAASSPQQVAQGIAAVAKQQPLPAPLAPHRDALLRMAWLTHVRAPSLHQSAFATLPMQLETVASTGEGLDGVLSFLRDLEAEAAEPGATFTGVSVLQAPGALGEQVVAASGEALAALVEDALGTLKRSGQLDQVIEAATAELMGHVEEGLKQGAFDHLVQGTPRQKSDRWVERGGERYREQDLRGALEAFDQALEVDRATAARCSAGPSSSTRSTTPRRRTRTTRPRSRWRRTRGPLPATGPSCSRASSWRTPLRCSAAPSTPTRTSSRRGSTAASCCGW
jgi:hypothetical protein